MPNLGPTELIIILVIVLLIFGAGKLGSLGGSLGQGVKDFRSAVRDGAQEDAPEDGPAKVASAGGNTPEAEAVAEAEVVSSVEQSDA